VRGLRGVRVVRWLREARVVRRWAVVAAGLAVLCGLPVIASALPASVPALTAGQLRARILASAGMSYAGYAESNATFGLPALPGLTGVASLFDGATKMRIWEASPSRWRVDVLSDAGERDTYQIGRRSYIWDSGAELLTEVYGRQSLRLPRPADLAPPALALRLLAEAGRQARFSVIPPLRVAGQSAAGLRITPTDPASTIGHINIWAQPGTGLPLMVEVFGRGSTPALLSQFFQVSSWRPDPGVLTPRRGPGTGFTVTRANNLAGVLNNLVPLALPPQLVGRDRLPAGFSPIGVYGGGLATFAVLGLPGSVARNLVAQALSAGGTELAVSGGTGALIGAPLINAVIIRPADPDTIFLLVGTVSPDVLEQAAGMLLVELGISA
jgi:hypothetical protein